MPNKALSFFAGLGQGIQGARQQQKERTRQDYLDSLQERQVAQGERTGAANIEQGNRQAAVQERGATVNEGQLQLGRDQFLEDTSEVAPGGFTVMIGGSPIRLPGRMSVMQRIMPMLTQSQQDAAANQRLGRELNFRESHPEQYTSGGSQPLTRERAIQQLLTDVYGNPQLGERPGSRASMFDEAFNKGQEVMPDIYGDPKITPTDEFFINVRDDPRFGTRDAARAMVNNMIRSNPEAWRQLDSDRVEQWVNSLPAGSMRRREVKPFGQNIPREDQDQAARDFVK
jgi:hypothetical protein